jgi:hypothetical protein
MAEVPRAHREILDFQPLYGLGSRIHRRFQARKKPDPESRPQNLFHELDRNGDTGGAESEDENIRRHDTVIIVHKRRGIKITKLSC